MCDHRLFGPQIATLGQDRMIFDHVPKNTRLSAMADTFLANAPDRFALAGLSMGGILALEIIARAPDRATRLALMDTTPRADAPENHAIRTRQIADVHAGHLGRVMREELKPAYLNDSPQKPALLDLCMAMAHDLGPDIFEAQATALRDRPSLEVTLGQITVPTLVLCGAQDRLCPPARHQEMHARIPRSHLVLIQNAGHRRGIALTGRARAVA